MKKLKALYYRMYLFYLRNDMPIVFLLYLLGFAVGAALLIGWNNGQPNTTP